MALRRKKKKSKPKRISLKLSPSKKKNKTDTKIPGSTGLLKVLAVIFVLAVMVTGLVFLDKYVKKVAPAWSDNVNVELIEPPVWINQPLEDKILAAITLDSEDFTLDENAVRLIQDNLTKNVAWLHNIKVEIAHNKILIEADYRKPIALVKAGMRQFYVDAELVVLDFIPMPDLPIVKVKGLSPITKIPLAGKAWQRDDLKAAVAILDRLHRMDKLVTPDKPLLYEIDSINVSNFRGREDSRFAHIILYAKDNTEIIWGAEIDAWPKHLEAKDEEKLAKLYNHYKEYDTLLDNVKYINLRDPQDTIPLPVDKY